MPISNTFQDTPLRHSPSIPTLFKVASISLENPRFCWEEERQIQSEVRQGGAHKTGVPTGTISCPDDLLAFTQSGWVRIKYRQDVPVPQPSPLSSWWPFAYVSRRDTGPICPTWPWTNGAFVATKQKAGKHACSEQQTYSYRKELSLF